MRRVMVVGYLLALAAAGGIAVAGALARLGVTGMTSPMSGLTVALFSGSALMAATQGRRFNPGILRDRRVLSILLIGGLITGLGQITWYLGLEKAPLVVVSPLSSLSPLFTVLTFKLFLEHLERISLRLGLGTVLIVAGAVLVTVGRYG